MSARTLVLASGSPARLKLLQDAGIDPVVVVSGVAEDDVDGSDTPGSVGLLAVRKAEAVARRAGADLVLGCDSMLEFNGRSLGKPESVDEARAWLTSMRGRSAVLYTGHCVIDQATGTRAEAIVGTTVRFAVTTDAELDAYLSTPDALAVAGAFTLDGRSAPFVDGIEGDHGNVSGLSLPTLRSLLAELGVDITDLWRDGPR
jgi:septum formation protein